MESTQTTFLMTMASDGGVCLSARLPQCSLKREVVTGTAGVR